jgi:hypothetical protein
MNYQELGLNSFQVSQDHPQFIEENHPQVEDLVRRIIKTEKLIQEYKENPKPLYSVKFVDKLDCKLDRFIGIPHMWMKLIIDFVSINPWYYSNINVEQLTDKHLDEIRPNSDGISNREFYDLICKNEILKNRFKDMKELVDDWVKLKEIPEL